MAHYLSPGGLPPNEGLLESVAGVLLPTHPGEDASWDELDEYYNTALPRSLSLYELASSMGLLPEEYKNMGSQDFRLALNYLSGSGEDVPYGTQEEVDDLLGEIHRVYGGAPKSGGLLSEESIVSREDPVGGLTGGGRREADNIWTDTSGKRGQQKVWYPSENPDYPVEEGWEFMMYNPRFFSGEFARRGDRNWQMHNMLGMESIVRRKPVEDGYEYQIVEPWDLEFGEDDPSLTKFSANRRQFPDWMLNMAETLFPELVEIGEFYTENMSQPSLGETMYSGNYRDRDAPEFRSASISESDYAKHYLDEYAEPIDIIGKSLILGKEFEDWGWREQ